jgi:hypothetical protein
VTAGSASGMPLRRRGVGATRPAGP